MENTSSLLFDHKNEKYHLVVRGKTVGPLTAEEVFKKIETNEITLLDFIWMKGWSDWKRIHEVKEFEVLVPAAPGADILKTLQNETRKPKKSEMPPPFEAVSYYLYFNKTQYGPFSFQEIEKVILSRKVDAATFAWIPGWTNWKPLGDIPELKGFFGQDNEPIPLAKASKDKSKLTPRDKRSSPRKPLVARLFVTNNEDVIVAVCRDISVGGMQVLTDRIPGEIGTTIKLNVSPADAKNVKGFVAEGELVRVLEDGRGFSFRFTKLSPDAKKTIQEYIEG